jgi:DNA-binding NarL/FixJ family response regulator
MLLYHADLPVVTATSVVEAQRRLRSGICRALLLDQTVLNPGMLALIESLTHQKPQHPLGVLVPPTAAAYAPLFLSLGVRVLLNTEATPEEFLMGIGALLRGDSFLSPPFPEAIRKALVDMPPHGRLSVREWQIFLLLLQGKSYSEIGRLLGIEPKTASTYRSRLARKLGCTSRAELFQYAYAHRLLHEFTVADASE